MTIRWQIWFLITFFVCASWTIYGSMGAQDKGREQAEANWTWVTAQNQPSLAAYCAAKNLVPVKGKVEKNIDIFNEDNPLFCAATLDQAKEMYAVEFQRIAKDSSIRTTFTFIGVWIAIIAFAALLSRLMQRLAARRSKK